MARPETTAWWRTLPAEVRDEVDRHTTTGRSIAGLVALRAAAAEPPSLVELRYLAHDRAEALGVDLAPPLRPERPDVEERLDALDAPIVAIEAVWDGDTTGWCVELLAIVSRGGRHAAVHLGAYRGAGGDARLFDGTVPPWPEAEAAAAAGEALASARSVPFHFASPDEPDDLAPRWSVDLG